MVDDPAPRDASTWSDSFLDLRGQVPAAREDASESAWVEFLACCRQLDRRIASMGSKAREQAHRIIERASHNRSREAWAASDFAESEFPQDACYVEEVMAQATRNGRVCPIPSAWRRLYLALPAKRSGRVLPRAPYPLDRIAWSRAGDAARRGRLREQVEWAAEQGVLSTLQALLDGLREDDWHHVGEQRWRG